MTYVGNTAEDRQDMLAAIGVNRFEDLIEAIPEAIRYHGSLDVPVALDEHSLLQRLRSLASKNANLEDYACFLGAGIYDHFRPAVVGALASRGEFATAYTPYQPEVSQGMLQAIYEYQTLICALTGMDMANASMYDAASGLAEAALMATDVTGRRQVVVSSAVHPHCREVLRTYAHATGRQVVEAPFDAETSETTFDGLCGPDTAAVIVQHPNFFGALEDMDGAVAAARASGALAVSLVDPISLGLLKPPGAHDVDVAVGEGQPLGNAMGFGGPLLGFFACKKAYARAFPGRIVGATTDGTGRRGYTMTLRTREQDIRRERATSNICTNETLLAVAAAVHLCELGASGMRRVAELCLQKAAYARQSMTSLAGVEDVFPGARCFKEFAVRLPVDASDVNAQLLASHVIGGLPLRPYYPNLGNAVLTCVTETRSRQEIDRLVSGIGTACLAHTGASR